MQKGRTRFMNVAEGKEKVNNGTDIGAIIEVFAFVMT